MGGPRPDPAIAAELLVLTTLITPALYRMLGYWDDLVRWPAPWGIVAMFGSAYLAVGLAMLWSPRLRACLTVFLRPRPPTLDVLRFCGVLVLVLLALAAVPRAFTGWQSFQVPQSQADYQHELRVTDCQEGVDTRFPEYSGTLRQQAIDLCVGRT